MPKVSVIIPSFNHSSYIEKAINSVLNQTEKDLELIVVDDGSTDSSVEIIKKYPDQRLHLIEQSNQGAHAAINRGLKESSGEFVSILNSDDTYHPERLQKLIAQLEINKDIGLAGSYIEVVDQNDKHLGLKRGYKNLEPWLLENPERSFRMGDDLRGVLLTENYFATTSNFIFRKEWFERIGNFRPLRYTHDWDFALRLSLIARLELVPEALLQYRVHPSNTIREDQAAMIFEICWILAVHLPDHLADNDWFENLSIQDRADQLLTSIYTFGNDRILSLLLLHRLSDNLDFAMDLLKPENPIRKKYQDHIAGTLIKEEIINNRQSTSRQSELIPTLKSILIKKFRT